MALNIFLKMAGIISNSCKVVVTSNLLTFQFILGYVAINLLLKTNQHSNYIVSADSITKNYGSQSNNKTNNIEDIEQMCADCRLASNSIEDLLRKPRQMNSYGQMDDRIDPEKIKKAVCKDIMNDKERERCRNFYFTQLTSIEKWKKSNSRTSFFDFICIKELKYCCPRNSYGPKCTKCNECSYNECCQGEGTRSGNGSCICKEGHTGPNCTSCLPGYYLYSDKSNLQFEHSSTRKILCKTCHRSCMYCRKEGPLGCEVCQSGFTWIPAHGCSDIDECIKNKKICGENTFCVNTEGSYFCYECDRACHGCYGDGPDMCLRCAGGYKLENGNCVALKKTILPPEANYFSLIGLGVAMYIGVSEYIMSTHIIERNQGLTF